MKNAYIPAPIDPVEIIASPNDTNAPYTTGHAKNNINVATSEAPAVTIATHLLH